MSSSRIVVALRVHASPARAFAAFTEEIGAWWRPNPLFAFARGDLGRLSFEPGQDGRLISILADGSVFEIGKVLEWSPPDRLEFGWRQASFARGEDTRVVVSFEPAGEQTRITVEHHGWDTIPAAHVARHGFPDAVFLRRHAEWWRSLLDGLDLEVDRAG